LKGCDKARQEGLLDAQFLVLLGGD
jgi:hypothetical protein